METGQAKWCAILIAMGGPGSLEEVRRYLYNIFSDRMIIRLPGGSWLQKPLARVISCVRHRKVEAHYSLIGGRSPLPAWTESQREQVERRLRSRHPSFRCFVGMRYTEPGIETAIAEAIQVGFTHICVVPMYPQYCRATTGSSFEVISNVRRLRPELNLTLVKDFHDHPDYLSMLHDYIDTNIRSDETLLFSAHSIPERLVAEGDPYVSQVRKTAAGVAGGRDYVVAFQSRTGPVKWVGPDTVEEVNRLLRETSQGVFVVPISFVCDHIETSYEIDIELKQKVDPEHAARIRRMPMFNDDPRFAQLLSSIVEERMTGHVAD